VGRKELIYIRRAFFKKVIKESVRTVGKGLSLSYKLDKVDLRIINALAKDARKTITQIAKNTEISRPTAINRLKKLRKSDVVILGARINVTKLGFKLALVALKNKSVEARQKPDTNLAMCPRVLLLIQTSENPNYLALLYGENTETLVSVIECFKNFSGMEVISWHRSKMPLLPETFALKIFLKKNELAPCGKKCGDCSNYQNMECLGCPAVTEYKGPL